MFFITPRSMFGNISDGVDRDTMMIKSIFKIIFDEEGQRLFLSNETSFTMPNTQYEIISDFGENEFKLGIQYSSYKLVFETDFELFSIQIYKNGIRSKFIRRKEIDNYYFLISPDDEDGIQEVDFSTFAEAVVNALVKRFGNK